MRKKSLLASFLRKAARVSDEAVRKTYVDENANFMARAFAVINLAIDDWRRSERRIQEKGVEKRKALVRALTTAAYKDMTLEGPDSWWIENVVKTLGETVSWGAAFHFALRQHNEALVRLSARTCILLYQNLYKDDYIEELQALHEMIMQMEICTEPEQAEIMLACCMDKHSEHVEIGEKLFEALKEVIVVDAFTPNLLVTMIDGYVRVREYAKAEQVFKLAKTYNIELQTVGAAHDNFWGWLLLSEQRLTLSEAGRQELVTQSGAYDMVEEAGNFGIRSSQRRMAAYALSGDTKQVKDEFNELLKKGDPPVACWNCYTAAMIRGNQLGAARVTLRRMRDAGLFDDFTRVLMRSFRAVAHEDDDDDEPKLQKEKDPVQRPKLSEDERNYVRDQILSLGGGVRQVRGLEDRDGQLELLKNVFSQANEMRE